MFTIAKLFGKSPFLPLQHHMEKVAKCIEKIPLLLVAFTKRESSTLEKLSKEISKLEHEADLTKEDIRTHLPKSLFLPIDRGIFLRILSFQDDLADKAEDIAILTTLRSLKPISDFENTFELFWKKNIEAFHSVHEIINFFNVLLEASFGGMEAEKVKNLTQETARKEHEADRLQYELLKHLYQNESHLIFADFYLWISLIKEISAISNISENLGDTVRLILEK